MYHVNGYAQNASIIHIWPFSYISTNLNFTSGSAYGNVLIPTADPRYQLLFSTTQSILTALPCPSDLVFHLELFEMNNQLLLCEIAARRPGGSIGPLIDVLEGEEVGWFAKYEFRASIGLKVPACRERQHLIQYGDLLVPLRVGKLVKIPTLPCPVDGVEYKQIAPLETCYTGFSINHMNTCGRLIAKGAQDCAAYEIEVMLMKAKTWLDCELGYEEANTSVIVGVDKINKESKSSMAEAEMQGRRSVGPAI